MKVNGYEIKKEADLRWANLEGADLTGANLEGANLTGANLEGADLENVHLWNCIGNMEEVKSLQLDRYCITYTSEVLQIGCEKHTIQEWKEFDEEHINRMDIEAYVWWVKWKDFIMTAIEMAPATPTGGK